VVGTVADIGSAILMALLKKNNIYVIFMVQIGGGCRHATIDQ
jgi:hypothetical protein